MQLGHGARGEACVVRGTVSSLFEILGFQGIGSIIFFRFIRDFIEIQTRIFSFCGFYSAD